MKVLILLLLTACAPPVAVPREPIAHPHEELLYWCWEEGKLEATPTLQANCGSTPSFVPTYEYGKPIYFQVDEASRPTLEIALQQWNLVLGGDWLRILPDDGREAHVVVSTIAERECLIDIMGNVWCVHGRAGVTRATPDARNYQTTVTIFLSGIGGTAVMCHEIGHILGLRHDQDEVGTLMYPSVSGMGLPEPQDIALLKRLHGWK